MLNPSGYGAASRLAGVRDVPEPYKCALLPCIAGNPFRPAVVDPGWRTPTVLALAAAIYEGRGFDRLPILADALEETGCSDGDVLGHCRDAGPHARGC